VTALGWRCDASLNAKAANFELPYPLQPALMTQSKPFLSLLLAPLALYKVLVLGVCPASKAAC